MTNRGIFSFPWMIVDPKLHLIMTHSEIEQSIPLVLNPRDHLSSILSLAMAGGLVFAVLENIRYGLQKGGGESGGVIQDNASVQWFAFLISDETSSSIASLILAWKPSMIESASIIISIFGLILLAALVLDGLILGGQGFTWVRIAITMRWPKPILDEGAHAEACGA